MRILLLGCCFLLAGCAATAVPAEVSDPGYPATVQAPGSAPALPADRPVGTGQLLVTCHGCHWYLQVAGGGRYALLASTEQVASREDDTTVGALLSPDGRWLAVPTGEPFAYDYRDLAGTTVRRAGMPVAWSASGRYVVSQDLDQSLHRIDLASGATVPVAGPGRVDAVLSTGAVVVARPAPNPFQLPSIAPRPSPSPGARAGGLALVVLDPGSGRQRVVTADVRRVLREDEQRSESLQWFGAAVSPDGTEVALLLSEPSTATDLVRFALSDGHPLGRRTVPSSTAFRGYGADGALLAVQLTGAGGIDLVRLGAGDPVTVTRGAPGVVWRPRGPVPRP